MRNHRSWRKFALVTCCVVVAACSQNTSQIVYEIDQGYVTTGNLVVEYNKIHPLDDATKAQVKKLSQAVSDNLVAVSQATEKNATNVQLLLASAQSALKSFMDYIVQRGIVAGAN